MRGAGTSSYKNKTLGADAENNCDYLINILIKLLQQ